MQDLEDLNLARKYDCFLKIWAGETLIDTPEMHNT